MIENNQQLELPIEIEDVVEFKMNGAMAEDLFSGISKMSIKNLTFYEEDAIKAFMCNLNAVMYPNRKEEENG